MRARKTMVIAIVVVGVMALLGFAGWLGLQVQPAPFPDYPAASRSSETTVLPAGLPTPVERWYRTVYGESVPVVHSVVITGRGRIAPFGVWFPARFRFTHDAGKGYRHYMEATWFGMPFLKVNERYLDGASLFELPSAHRAGRGSSRRRIWACGPSWPPPHHRCLPLTSA